MGGYPGSGHRGSSVDLSQAGPTSKKTNFHHSVRGSGDLSGLMEESDTPVTCSKAEWVGAVSGVGAGVWGGDTPVTCGKVEWVGAVCGVGAGGGGGGGVRRGEWPHSRVGRGGQNGRMAGGAGGGGSSMTEWAGGGSGHIAGWAGGRGSSVAGGGGNGCLAGGAGGGWSSVAVWAMAA